MAQSLREPVLPMLVNEPEEYPEPGKDDTSKEALLPEQERNIAVLPTAPSSQQVVLLCLLSAHIPHLTWWLTMEFADHVDIVHMYVKIANDECTEIQLTFQDASNPLDW